MKGLKKILGLSLLSVSLSGILGCGHSKFKCKNLDIDGKKVSFNKCGIAFYQGDYLDHTLTIKEKGKPKLEIYFEDNDSEIDYVNIGSKGYSRNSPLREDQVFWSMYGDSLQKRADKILSKILRYNMKQDSINAQADMDKLGKL